MMAEMTASDWMRWQAYDAMEPINGTDYVLAQLAAMFHNANAKKGAKLMRPSDFMPMEKIIEPQTAEEMEANFRAFAKRRNQRRGNHRNPRRAARR